MSWFTRSKNVARSTSTTTRRPACTQVCAARTHPPARTARTVTVGVLAEVRVQERLQHLQQRLLDQAIRHRRDAELALAPPGLGIATKRTGWGRYVPDST